MVPILLQSHLELSFWGALPNPHLSLDSPKPAGKEEANEGERGKNGVLEYSSGTRLKGRMERFHRKEVPKAA